MHTGIVSVPDSRARRARESGTKTIQVHVHEVYIVSVPESLAQHRDYVQIREEQPWYSMKTCSLRLLSSSVEPPVLCSARRIAVLTCLLHTLASKYIDSCCIVVILFLLT